MRVHTEIVIAEVAAAHDGQGIAHDHNLVVHPVVHPVHVGQETEKTAAALGKGVENMAKPDSSGCSASMAATCLPMAVLA